MDTDGIELQADVVIAAYKQRVSELQEQVIMLQAYLAQAQRQSEALTEE